MSILLRESSLPALQPPLHISAHWICLCSTHPSLEPPANTPLSDGIIFFSKHPHTVFLTRATDSNLVDDISPRCPRVIPYALALSAKTAARCASAGCIESGDDLVPFSWSVFGRTARVGVDGCLTGSFMFFIAGSASSCVVRKNG